jgi:hypothetical protein
VGYFFHQPVRVSWYFLDMSYLSFSAVTQVSFPYFDLFLCGSNGVWIQGLMLARQAFYHLSHSASQIFFFKHYYVLQEVRAPWRNVIPGLEWGKDKISLTVFVPIKEKCSKNESLYHEGTETRLQRLAGQIRNNVNIKIMISRIITHNWIETKGQG